MDALAGVPVVIASQQSVSVPLVLISAQELGHFEFTRFLKHELSPQTDGLRERRVSGGRAEELFFEGLAGELTFHGWVVVGEGFEPSSA